MSARTLDRRCQPKALGSGRLMLLSSFASALERGVRQLGRAWEENGKRGLRRANLTQRSPKKLHQGRAGADRADVCDLGV